METQNPRPESQSAGGRPQRTPLPLQYNRRDEESSTSRRVPKVSLRSAQFVDGSVVQNQPSPFGVSRGGGRVGKSGVDRPEET